MSTRYREDEKKVEDLTYLEDLDDDHIADFRMQRLERQLDLLTTELWQVKQQQAKGQSQVLELQADLVAAELARQAAEEQLGLQQRHDHDLMISLFRKFMAKEPEVPAVIDVTKYDESESDDVPPCDDAPAGTKQQLAKQLQELSLAVQQHSSDQLQQREALELAWENYKNDQSQCVKNVEDETAALYKGLKDMAVTCDKKLHDMNAQIQKVKKIVSCQNISAISTRDPTLDTEIAEKLQMLTTEMNQLQQSMKRHLDSNRHINGERIVSQRKTEQDLRSMRHAIKRLAAVVFGLTEKLETPENAKSDALESLPEMLDNEHIAPCAKVPSLDETEFVDELEAGPDLETDTESPDPKLETIESIYPMIPSPDSMNANGPSDTEPCFIGEVHAYPDKEPSPMFCEETNDSLESPEEVDFSPAVEEANGLAHASPEPESSDLHEEEEELDDTRRIQKEETVTNNHAVDDVFDKY